ncbi:acyl carrier protein [Primorskyibacter aestuariivivens]|uniref:acyl carrier protein n=1 Tax=Primorskyibacter aestuariivivens TaxID=1888912 RepID=UPI00230144B6|nr:acyl carrier protein [Primorskyibacter aestuariivivens]MDA7429492.1 acyl carrier protein [Primorskyibacter aestuariivivens]
MSFQSLRSFIAEEFALDIPADRLTPELDLIETGIVDSLGVLKLIAFLEGEYDLTITPDELDADLYRSIGQIEELIASKTAAAA